MAQKIKEGYAAEAAARVDLGYFRNILAELKDCWSEIRDSVLQIWNTAWQLVEMILILIPVLRIWFKKIIDKVRFHW